MKVTLIKCDCCHKPIKGNPTKISFQMVDRETDNLLDFEEEQDIRESMKVYEMDWCPVCSRNLMRFLRTNADMVPVAPLCDAGIAKMGLMPATR